MKHRQIDQALNLLATINWDKAGNDAFWYVLLSCADRDMYAFVIHIVYEWLFECLVV